MKVESLFARRYLFSRKSHSVINIISVVSAVAVAVPVAAMVILLSVFNGFEGLVRGMYTDFDPDALITPATGKTFAVQGLHERLATIEGVEAWSCQVEENAMVDYRGGQAIVTIRGVDSLYDRVVPIEKRITHGGYALHFGSIEQAIVGQGVAWQLGVNTAMYDYLHLYTPRREAINPLLPIEAYRRGELLPAGVFALDAQTDGRYILAPIEFAQRLFDYPDRATGVAVKLAPGASVEPIREALGAEFKVLTRYEQKASLYRIMRYEKWGIFLIVALVMVIASFCVVGSVAMLVIDKREDIRTLSTMGATLRFLRSIFTREGMLVALSGAGLGMLLGVGVCLGQQQWGWVRIPAQTFAVEAYPVVVQWSDLAMIAALIGCVSFLIVRLTTLKMISKQTIRLLLIALCLVQTACSPRREIPEAQLEAMLEEIYVANAYLLHNSNIRRDSVDIYTPIFQKWGYTPRELSRTLESFSRRKSSSVGDVLTATIERLGARYDFYNARLAAIDTITARALDHYKQLVYTDTLIEARQPSDTSHLRLRLKAEPGSYKIDYTYLLDTFELNAGLYVSHLLRDSLGKQLAYQPNWLARLRPMPYSVTLQAPETTRQLEIVFGNYGLSAGGTRMPVQERMAMRIDTLLIYHYPPAQQAIEQYVRMLFPTARPERELPGYVADGAEDFFGNPKKVPTFEFGNDLKKAEIITNQTTN